MNLLPCLLIKLNLITACRVEHIGERLATAKTLQIAEKFIEQRIGQLLGIRRNVW